MVGRAVDVAQQALDSRAAEVSGSSGGARDQHEDVVGLRIPLLEDPDLVELSWSARCDETIEGLDRLPRLGGCGLRRDCEDE